MGSKTPKKNKWRYFLFGLSIPDFLK
jgi:hypothetical protein